MERRKINFTDEERTILMDLMDRHRDVLECKKTDAVSIHAKKKTWEKLADEFNSNHNVRPRTSKQLKKCWDNLKEKWRRAKAEDTRELFKTGGGTPAESQMSDELRRVGAVASHMATRLANPFDSDRTGPGVEATPAVAALLTSSQPGRSTDADDADMQCDDLWQWELPHTQDEVAMDDPAPQSGEAARPVSHQATRPASPPAAAAPSEVLPAAVATVPPARRKRRLDASGPSSSRDDAVKSELVARLAAISKDAQQKSKEHFLRMKVTPRS
ncbi:hypothetical protein HPB49_026405 [Dermacentor silvarum]|nr:hypothetical protein HPB49_026405 [Dermacentor silvarum]